MTMILLVTIRNGYHEDDDDDDDDDGDMIAIRWRQNGRRSQGWRWDGDSMAIAWR